MWAPAKSPGLLFRRFPMYLFEEVIKLRREGKRGALATIVHTNGSIPSYESSRMLVREDGSIAGTIGGGCVEADVWAAAKEVMQKELSRKMVFNLNHEASYDSGLICGGTLEIFVEPILPQPVVYLFGGGHVSIAVANAASAAGFGIAVVDDREAFANLQRFPMAQGRYARAGVGGADGGALRGDDWQQAQSSGSVQGAGDGGLPGG